MTNLEEKHSADPMEVPTKKEPKITYPTLCIRDKSLEAVFGKELPDVGEELEATVKLRVKGVRSDEYGKSVDFEVVAGEFGELEEVDSEEENPKPTAKTGKMYSEMTDA
jgi:hypothetical protein